MTVGSTDDNTSSNQQYGDAEEPAIELGPTSSTAPPTPTREPARSSSIMGIPLCVAPASIEESADCIVGTTATDDEVAIEIDREIFESIRRFAHLEHHRELGGILIGVPASGNRGRSLKVLGAIEARHSDSRSTTLKFTHESWEYINGVKDSQYPNAKVIGWFHTHPNFGIFLSAYDTFIHENFFNDSGQIAMVVDPVRDQVGFFQWHNGALTPAPAFALTGTSAGGTMLVPPVAAPSTPRHRPRWIPSAAAAAVIVGIGLYIGHALGLIRMNSAPPAPAPPATQAIAESRGPAATNTPSGAPSLVEDSARGQTTFHIMSDGDTLWELARRHGGSEYLWPELLRANPELEKWRRTPGDNWWKRIPVGTKIRIPPSWETTSTEGRKTEDGGRR